MYNGQSREHLTLPKSLVTKKHHRVASDYMAHAHTPVSPMLTGSPSKQSLKGITSGMSIIENQAF
jgi:hypothetical protein